MAWIALQVFFLSSFYDVGVFIKTVSRSRARSSSQMSLMEQKFQILLRNVINQNNSGVDVEALVTMLSTPCTSTSTHQIHLEDNLPHTV
ncbi:hypothetical protein Lal_00011038 [Lupinus albus]|nr:hypothetical protein Lal_00011038 [Lupinus albus]